MNNTRYMDWIDDLYSSAFHQTHALREFTACYLAEAREGDTLDMHYEVVEEGCIQVDFHRNANQEDHRVFSARLLFD